MVNLAPQREDTRKDIDLVQLTRRMIRTLEEQLGRTLPFVATIHNADHSPLRHMHGIFLLHGGRLSPKQFQDLRVIATTTATEEAARQRRMLDRVRENPRLRLLAQAYAKSRPHGLTRDVRTPKPGRARGIKQLFLQQGCSYCGYGQKTGIPKWRTSCPSCHRPLNRAHTLRLTREVSA